MTRAPNPGAPRKPPRWLVWLVGTCGLTIAVIDHPFQRGPLRTVSLVLCVAIIVAAVAWDRWPKRPEG